MKKEEEEFSNVRKYNGSFIAELIEEAQPLLLVQRSG